MIDGKLDDVAWASTAWTSTGFVDITNHTEEPAYNVVPDQFQTRASCSISSSSKGNWGGYPWVLMFDLTAAHWTLGIIERHLMST